jgi:hypothetical protein
LKDLSDDGVGELRETRTRDVKEGKGYREDRDGNAHGEQERREEKRLEMEEYK